MTLVIFVIGYIVVIARNIAITICNLRWRHVRDMRENMPNISHMLRDRKIEDRLSGRQSIGDRQRDHTRSYELWAIM